MREGDAIECGWQAAGMPPPAPHRHFVADARLGALARFLRMLGFDTVHANTLSDPEIRRLAGESHRVVLTRDRELLKCREIATGAYVRALAPEAQLHEVATRFDLARHARPFTLCLYCNVTLTPVDKARVLDRLPAQVASSQERFHRCERCERVYWPGTHYARMCAVLRCALGAELRAGA